MIKVTFDGQGDRSDFTVTRDKILMLKWSVRPRVRALLLVSALWTIILIDSWTGAANSALQWRRCLYAIWWLTYHFTKWYASQLNWRTTFCVVI